MISYISTQSISSSMRQSILRMQTELAASETEVATGNYADIGLTLGAQTGESVSLQAQSSFTGTNQTVATRLGRTSSTRFFKAMVPPQTQPQSRRPGKAISRA